MRSLLSDFDQFDRLILFVIGGLLVAIVGVVLGGNNIGVQIEGYSPQALARSDVSVRIRFYEEMNTQSVEERFTITPQLEGNFRWNAARELVFEPSNALPAGEQYVVEVQAGAISQNSNAELKEPLQFEFQIGLPRVLYLAPSGAQDRNLYLYDLNTQETEQLTFNEYGIADYNVSPDGNYIAYTIYNEDGSSDIWLYSIATGATSQLTDCVNAYCVAPNWHPNGSQVAYERNDFDPIFGQQGGRRIWTVDLATVQSSLLFDDTQITGHSPRYSPNGNRIALFATNPPGILVYDFVNESRVFVENIQGVVGTFSPDSTKLVYPVLMPSTAGSQFTTKLELVDLQENRRSNISGDDSNPLEDSDGVWRPGYENQLAVTRRYLDNRYTDGKQIYLLDIEEDSAQPLVVDDAYTHGALGWSEGGNMLVFQRFEWNGENARPEIWVYNLQTEAYTRVAHDAFLPSFIP